MVLEAGIKSSKMKYLEEYIKRDSSCLTGLNLFSSIAVVDEFPVFFGVTNEPIEKDLYAKMEWFLEKETGLIQLNKLIPLEILYQTQHAYGFGQTWENHYSKFSDFLLSTNPQKVLEIGGGQGRIAQICSEKGNIQEWTIIEPNPTFKPTKKIKIIKGFFDRNFEFDNNFDTYCFSHVLEHAYDPKDFLVCLFEKMKVTDNLIFSYPNLRAWLSKFFTNSLNFEHTIFLTVEHLQSLLINIGFEVINRTDYLEHSHFFHLKKSKIPNLAVSYLNLSEENSSLLRGFLQYHKDEVKSLNYLIEKLKSKKIFLFGAHIFSQYLKVFGLKVENIVSILDNSIEKHGLRLYGTELLVESPKTLSKYESPVVILRAGPYNDEIKKQILFEINPNVIFI